MRRKPRAPTAGVRIVVDCRPLSPERDGTRGSALEGDHRQLAITTTDLATLSQRLYAVPYMADPRRLYYTDDRGHLALGFQSGDSTPGGGYIGFEDIFRGSETFIATDLARTCRCSSVTHACSTSGAAAASCSICFVKLVCRPSASTSIQRWCTAVATRGTRREHRRQRLPACAATFLAAGDHRDSGRRASTLRRVDLVPRIESRDARVRRPADIRDCEPPRAGSFKTFWTDLTHQRPIFPKSLCPLRPGWLRSSHVFFPNGTGTLDRDRPVQGEYAVVATKGRPD